MGHSQRISNNPYDWKDQRLAGVYHQMKGISKHYDCDVPTLALAWLLQLPGPVLPLLGTSKSAHVLSACKALKIELRRDHWYELMAIGSGSGLPFGGRTLSEAIHF